MSVLCPRIPMAIYLYREDPSLTQKAVWRRSALAILKRRSVSSMKDLLPLSLPKPRCNSPEIEPVEDVMTDEVGQCLPEVLARDLEMCSAMFVAKNMTAGPPSTALAHEEKNQQRTMSCPGRILTSPYQTASLRVQSLGAIEERNSVVSFLEHRGYGTEETSDLDSLHGTESSGGLGGPCIRIRQQSITTTATSLTSASGSAPSPKVFQSWETSRGHSWIHDESDDDIDIHEKVDATCERPIALSPRPPTPPNTDCVFDNMGSIKELARSRTPLHQKTDSTDNTPSRRHELRSINVPRRRASLSCPTTSTDAQSMSQSLSPSPDSKATCRRRRRFYQPSHHTHNSYEGEVEHSNNFSFVASRHDDSNDREADSIGFDEDSIFDADLQSWPRPSTVYIQTTPPPSPLPTVQAWLEQSTPPYIHQMPVDDLVKAVPLPPDVMETLRVSIACFPETMLLSSSLTIETIRTYSKKVKHPSGEIWREPARDLTPVTPRKSLWKKVVSHGRESISTRLHRHQQSSDVVLVEATPRQGLPALPNAWAPLRHVFGSCSDYICDALYAHMVAYNYISRVPRNQPPPLHRDSMTSCKSQNEDIPKKAASLLGLDSPQHPFQPGVGRIAKTLSTPLWAFGKDEMTPGASSAAQDNTTRNIEAGLLRCILRLIGTARMMAEEGTSEERMMEYEPQEADMIFVRSLREIVRISEEATF
ncbi:hypothetical protein EDB81DRAFT_337292 [Dactylonectria macrodidyma]|uniref:Uncharacterized protein n=1 Tax=Dactylonectria macrodidyma TaxID=307937 RepID=A0A9P9JH10_9HYPO|nr:hypothetical protein EDB81DRAFT_337292 [Dactylonectria macrodidyma]